MVKDTALYPLRIKFPFLCKGFPPWFWLQFMRGCARGMLCSHQTNNSGSGGWELERLPEERKAVFTSFHLGSLSDSAWNAFFILKKIHYPLNWLKWVALGSQQYLQWNILCQSHTYTYPFLGNVPCKCTGTFWSLLIFAQCLYNTVSVTGKVLMTSPKLVPIT